MKEVEPGQDRNVAALTFTFHVHFLFGSDYMDDNYYMNIALQEANKAYLKDEVPVGCIIVQNNKIIGVGHNLKESTKNILNHAELIAIKKASKKINDWRLDNSVMYVTLYPCSMCASAIVSSRIKRIVIGAPTKDLKVKQIGDLIFEGNNLSPKIDVKENVLKDECVNLLGEFFKNKR